MAQDQIIKRKIVENAEKVDSFIVEALKDRKPKILYEASRHLIEAGGKRLRPFLTVKACEAVGGNPADAVPFAAALEILHNFTLVHDDVMDHDNLRRGNPTVHTKYGDAMAILAGDLLFAKVYDIMAKNAPASMSPIKVLSAIRKTTNATLTLCEGQALDISFPDAGDVNSKDYILMVGAKTSALFSACAEVGATVGGASDEQIEALGRFAWDAGIAFQIVDDILGITADEKKLGKPVGSDIREGKKTLIVIHALENATPEQKKVLMSALGVEDASTESIEAAVKTLYDIGSIQSAVKVAEDYTKNALKMLDVIPDNPAKDELKSLVEYFVKRDY
ncbi:MAG: polyprenyl synthetase family protein [Candidatus Bathyarchaeota archaeon]|nr:polyprenyl synthetase family protein [Candidatus Bathyarchaeota archaeon]